MSEKSLKLKKMLLSRGYPEEFCRIVAEQYMNTDYTAGKMLGFLANMPRNLRPEVIADEMYAILSDRKNYVDKKIYENAQSKMNLFMRRTREDE